MDNPHTSIVGYKVENWRKQVDIVIGMRTATQAHCTFWFGDQGAIMC